MDFRRICFLIIVMLGSAADSAAAVQQPAVPAGKSTVPAQVDPASDLAKLYPQAGSIGLALAIVPDPHIPRYRRLFDLEVQAITLGMLNDGYVLDRYSFPWSERRRDPRHGANAFGLMVFRCDGWRGHVCQDLATLPADADPVSGLTTRVRAIYLVTDTATWGVSTAARSFAPRGEYASIWEPRPRRMLPDGCARAPAN